MPTEDYLLWRAERDAERERRAKRREERQKEQERFDALFPSVSHRSEEDCLARATTGVLAGTQRPAPGERVVHAVMPDGSELVRYEGKGWRREWQEGHEPEVLTIGGAVHLAATHGAELMTGQPGGQAFLLRVRRQYGFARRPGVGAE